MNTPEPPMNAREPDHAPDGTSGLRKRVVRVIASRHVAGPTVDDALRVCRWARNSDYRVILSPWRSPGARPKDMLEQYLRTINTIIDQNIPGYVAIKLNAIGNEFEIFEELVGIARDGNVRLHLDSLDPDSAPLSFKFLERAAPSYQNLGTTLPARWKRSLDDVRRVTDLGISARIVKGQWSDPTARRLDCRENYLDIASQFVNTKCRVGVATHDYPLAEAATSILSSAQSPFEIEQFFSLPLNCRTLAGKLGCAYRLYVAYGYPDVPYNVRFSVSRPGIVGWVIQDFALRRRKPWEIGMTPAREPHQPAEAVSR